ncbi:MAG TPA: DNA-binding protein [Candidatus Nanoarchaeia archaeon]|nr:DNA-binding protein [Candidatus Nanoarchaeia archaeon]
MKIKEIQANQGNITFEAEVISLQEPRSFNKFGKEGRVCNAVIADASGEITLTLWNDDIDKVKAGDKINLENGWCSEYKDQKQVSAGKFGKLEVIEAKK